MGSFKAFNLSKGLVNALKKLGYEEPSPVQQNVIPKALQGKSLLAQSATGTGKTHSYLIPIIEKTDVSLPRLQSIIIAPTRELARQIYEFAREFERFSPKLKIRLFTSESDVSDNQKGLSVAPHIVIGTPGRIKDILVDKHELNLQNVRTVVLDEADMLLEMGYFEDIEALFNCDMREPQIMVFSATLKQNLKDELKHFVSSDFLFEAEDIHTSNTVNHHMIDIKHKNPALALLDFLSIRKPYLCLIFASRKENVDEAYKVLTENGIKSIYFTGDLNDRARKKALREIKEDKCPIIICSDILARGMDIPNVTDVISLDLPRDLEFYYHRAGRTGRFGKPGDSWIFYDDDSTTLPLRLIDDGTKFDFFILRGTDLKEDPVGLLPKTKLSKKKAFYNEQEAKEIKIAKAKTRSKKIKPGYKKRQQYAIDRVKKKYKRKAIQKSIRQDLEKQWKAESKRLNKNKDE